MTSYNTEKRIKLNPYLVFPAQPQTNIKQEKQEEILKLLEIVPPLAAISMSLIFLSSAGGRISEQQIAYWAVNSQNSFGNIIIGFISILSYKWILEQIIFVGDPDSSLLSSTE